MKICTGISALALSFILFAGGAPGFGFQAGPPPSQITALPPNSGSMPVRSIVDLPVEELRQTYAAVLGDINFDETGIDLDMLLTQVEERVASFFRDFPNTASRERVRRERLSVYGRVEDSVTQTYNYALYPDKTGGWQEGRTDSKGRDVEPDKMKGVAFLTSGFAGNQVFFHPSHKAGCRYRYLGRQAAEPHAHVIAFAQVPGKANFVGTFQSAGMAAPTGLLYQGLAWVDPQTFQIVRMRTDLLTPRSDILLDRQTSEIWFSEVTFGDTRTFWLPREVVVTFLWSGQRFRNRHSYSEYQVFTVETQNKIELPKVKKLP